MRPPSHMRQWDFISMLRDLLRRLYDRIGGPAPGFVSVRQRNGELEVSYDLNGKRYIFTMPKTTSKPYTVEHVGIVHDAIVEQVAYILKGE